MSKERILTGMRPTGPLHLGHYAGALENWVKYQHEYDSYFLIADYQALGDHLKETERIRNSVIEVTLDWLSVGLDPKASTFVVQSYVPEHAELTMLISMLTPLSMLLRNPTLKKEMEQQDPKDVSVGFFNYPVSQIADILLPKANLVPVGEDQLPHIELSREIARKFNKSYGEIFPIPNPLVGRVPRLVGTDGKAKMSKSLENCIYLSDSPEEVSKKVRGMFTDPTRIHATDPGHVEGNPVFIYLDAFDPNIEEVNELKVRYQKGTVGDVEVKRILERSLNDFLSPIRQKRSDLKSNPKIIEESLLEGTERARRVAQETMREVREVMKITRYENFQLP